MNTDKELEWHEHTHPRAAEDAAEDGLLQAEMAFGLAQAHWRNGHNRDALISLNRARRLCDEFLAPRAIAHERARSKALDELLFEIVRTWGSSVESNGASTHGHSSRVAEYATTLANAAGMDPSNATSVELGALLHDVGKVAVPDSVLNKPGPLTPEEWVVMRRHSAAGERLLSTMEFPWDIATMVRHHHEAWDGSGYPDNLSGEGIPWMARVLCVADVFDALTTARPYRDAYDTKDAMEIMDEMSGSTLDPELYRIFRRLVTEKRIGPAEEPVRRSRQTAGTA